METFKEESVAKRRRMEPQNAEQIIQELRMDLEEHRRVNQNLRVQLAMKDKRIQELEQKNLESPLMEKKIKNIMAEPKFSRNLMELPNECLLKILGYLSNFDVLRKVAVVSKKFHALSQDRHLIRKIKVDSESWPENQEEEYCKGFLEVLKRSLNLTFLSFHFGQDIEAVPGEIILKALPSINHQFLREFCLSSARGWISFSEDILKYFEKCPNLKVLKIEIDPCVDVEDLPQRLEHEDLYWIQEAITSFKLKNLQEFHLIGFEIDLDKSSFKKVLETIAENLPKLQRLCLTTKLNYRHEGKWDEYAKICQEFASEKKIKLEIRGVPIMCDFGYGVKSVCCGHYKVHPSKEMEIFSPK